MQGSQANRGARRYHYYVTNPADALNTPGRSWRMPAADLEATVIKRLTAFLSNSAALYDAASEAPLPEADFAEFIDKAYSTVRTINDEAAACLQLLRRVDINDDRIDLTLCIDSLLPAAK